MAPRQSLISHLSADISKPVVTCTNLYKPVQNCTDLTYTQESPPFTVLSQSLTICTNIYNIVSLDKQHTGHIVDNTKHALND